MEIEEVHNEDVKTQEEEEPCNCIIKLSTWALKCTDACNEIENLISESEESISNVQDIMINIMNYSNNYIEIYIKELNDLPKEVLIKGYKIKDAFENSAHDLEVNEIGRKLGRENPNKQPQDIIPIPKDLPKEHI